MPHPNNILNLEKSAEQLMAHFVDQHAKKHLIGFTAAAQAEGTSTVAYHFSQQLAEQCKSKVLRINATALASPKLITALKEKVPEAQLLEVLKTIVTKEKSFSSLNLKVGHSLNYIDKILILTKLIKILNAHYNYIVFDLPPLFSDADIKIWLGFLKGAFIIVEAERTRKPVVESAINRLQKFSVPLLGLVLNKRRYPINKSIYHWLYQ